MTVHDLEHSPFIAFLNAVAMAVLGYVLLSKGNLLIGAFAFWVSGVNTFRASRGWLRQSENLTDKRLQDYAEYCKVRDTEHPEMVGKWGKP